MTTDLKELQAAQLENLTLKKYSQCAINAHYWTSFHPEKRGEQLIKDYSTQLDDDINELKSEGINEENILDYKTRYEKLFSSWLNAKSRCFSAMITGPANFPVKRHEKALRSEENHYKIFQEWRARAKKSICRKAQPEKTFLSEIDRYKIELEGLKANHTKMKEGNKRIAAARKTGEDISKWLMSNFNIPPHMIEFTMKFGFGLTNNNANINRVEERIKIMEAKEQRSQVIGQKEFVFDGVIVIYNYEADRIQVKHSVKPPQEVINIFKHRGFRWSPSFGCWQRNLNSNGIWATESILKIKLPSLNF